MLSWSYFLYIGALKEKYHTVHVWKILSLFVMFENFEPLQFESIRPIFRVDIPKILFFQLFWTRTGIAITVFRVSKPFFKPNCVYPSVVVSFISRRIQTYIIFSVWLIKLITINLCTWQATSWWFNFGFYTWTIK